MLRRIFCARRICAATANSGISRWELNGIEANLPTLRLLETGDATVILPPRYNFVWSDHRGTFASWKYFCWGVQNEELQHLATTHFAKLSAWEPFALSCIGLFSKCGSKLNKQSTNCFGCPGLWKAKMDLVDQQMFGFEKGVELSYTGRFPHQKHQQKWQAKTPESTLGFLGAEDRRDLLWELLWRGLGGL